MLTGGQANALTVNVNSQDYNVTTFPGTYNANSSLFTTADMPWWGNAALASQFANQYALVAATVSPGFGVGSCCGGNFGDRGPFFAIGLNAGGGEARSYSATTGTASIFQLTLHHSYWAYAIASPVPSSNSSTASVPGPLPILGLAAAFGFSRQLRKRIKSSSNSVPSSSAS